MTGGTRRPRYVHVVMLAMAARIASCADQAPSPPTGGAEADHALATYHIGNSLTFGVASNPRFAEVMGTGIRGYAFGMHIRWGSPLSAIWDDRDHPSVAPQPFGPFPHALSAYAWQLVTLQPSFSVLEGPHGDVAMSEQFLALIRQKSPDAQCYVYETWPTIGKDAPAGAFRAKWDRTYAPGQSDGALYSHDYCRLLLDRLRADDPHAAKPPLLLPAGSVLAAVDARARADGLPKLPGVETLYNPDGVHLNEAGNYIVLCAWFAVLRGRSPVGLPALAPAFSDAQVSAIQELVWDVVQHDAACGIASSPAAAPAAPPR
jgi:hypothetical protein